MKRDSTDHEVATAWKVRGRTLSLARPLIMGIVNITPDSFSDGGQHPTHGAALAHARRLIEEGADILDIGGQSTRPGAADVALDEELERVVPLVESLAGEGVPLSVDTSKPEVMRAALDAGAAIVNDVNALQAPGAVDAVAESDCGVAPCRNQLIATSARSWGGVRVGSPHAALTARSARSARTSVRTAWLSYACGSRTALLRKTT